MALKKLGRVRFVAAFALGMTALLLMALNAQAAAPATTLFEPPTPLLPSTDTLVAASEQMPVPAETAEAQAVLREDGLRRSEARVTLVPAGDRLTASGWVKAYEFGDATGAFAAYTYLRAGGHTAGAAEGTGHVAGNECCGGTYAAVSGFSDGADGED